MQNVNIEVVGDSLSDSEIQEYIHRGRIHQPNRELVGIKVTVDGDFVDIEYKYDKPLVPRRFSIGDMLIEDFDSLNDAKQAEYIEKLPNNIK